MKKYLLLLNLFFALIVSAQQVEWTRQVSVGIRKGHFINNEFSIIGAMHDSVKIDSTVYSWNTQESFLASFKKDGTVDTVFHLANFLPLNFTVENDGYYIAGWGPFDLCMGKSELDGTIAWSECYQSFAPYTNQSNYYPSDAALSVVKYKSSLYIIGAYEDSILFENQWLYGSESLLAKINTGDGSTDWVRNIPYHANKIIGLLDGTFLIGHSLYSSASFDYISIPNNKAIVVSRTDTNGNFISAKVIAEDATMKDMAIDKNKNVFIAGSFYDTCKIGATTYIANNGGFFLIKTDIAGNIFWSKVFSEPNQNLYGAGVWSLSVAPDNSVFLTGSFHSDSLNFQDTVLVKAGGGENAFLAKYSSGGQLDYVKSLYATSGYCYVNEVSIDDDGAAYWWGWFSGQMQIENHIFQSAQSYSSYIVKISDNNVVVSENTQRQKFLLYPNPSTAKFTISSSEKINSFNVRNVVGKTISSGPVNSQATEIDGSTLFTINLSNQPKGIYFVEMLCGEERKTKKIVVE